MQENNFSDGPFCATRCTKLADAPHVLCADCYEKSQAKDLASDRVSTNSNCKKKGLKFQKREANALFGLLNLAEIRNTSKIT